MLLCVTLLRIEKRTAKITRQSAISCHKLQKNAPESAFLMILQTTYNKLKRFRLLAVERPTYEKFLTFASFVEEKFSQKPNPSNNQSVTTKMQKLQIFC